MKDKLKGDKKIRHQAWLDLGRILERLGQSRPAMNAEIERIRSNLYVPGEHHQPYVIDVATLAKTDLKQAKPKLPRT